MVPVNGLRLEREVGRVLIRRVVAQREFDGAAVDAAREAVSPALVFLPTKSTRPETLCKVFRLISTTNSG